MYSKLFKVVAINTIFRAHTTCMYIYHNTHYESSNRSSCIHLGPLDYVQITADDNLLVPFETDNSTHLQCFNVTIMEDTEFERNEDFSLTLSLEGSPLQTVVVEPFVSVVEIVDNDGESARMQSGSSAHFRKLVDLHVHTYVVQSMKYGHRVHTQP